MGDTAHHGGASFLVEPCGSGLVFIPEQFSEEQRELGRTAERFSKGEVLPQRDRIEASEKGCVRSLLAKAGELGLLMAEIPEAFGGLGLSKVDAAIIAEHMTHEGSFTVAFLCHTGIGMLPLVYYGTPEQKAKYLPRLATGEMVGAYALTEPEAGSDALSARTSAVRSPDGSQYVLCGEKAYCTNGGIADLITLFAKVGGDQFTAFLVEKGMPGVAIGHEEDKMGICGSSTTAILLADAQIPAANVLGDIGRGHRVALNTLNLGRFKLGAACLGSCKRMLEQMTAQANVRRQFGRPIGAFELIRQKIARAVCRTYVLESLVYRYAGALDAALAPFDPASGADAAGIRGAIEEYSVEAAIAKVFGSEALSSVADEAVQLFGGAGYIRGYAVEQEYRDCRVDRIFEGTNEICRLLIPATIIRRMMAGRLPLLQRFAEISGGLAAGFAATDPSAPFASLVEHVEGLKRIAVSVIGVALQGLGEKLKVRQAVVEAIADLVIESYAADSGVARAIAIHRAGDAQRAARAGAICEAWLAERAPILVARARQALINIAGGAVAECSPHLAELGRLIHPPVADTDRLLDAIAARALEEEGYEL